jgi:hypothetical protein
MSTNTKIEWENLGLPNHRAHSMVAYGTDKRRRIEDRCKEIWRNA